MSKNHADKINTAINDCLDEVSGFSNRSVVVAQYTAHLRNDPHWLEWEVREVEEAVHHTADLIAR